MTIANGPTPTERPSAARASALIPALIAALLAALPLTGCGGGRDPDRDAGSDAGFADVTAADTATDGAPAADGATVGDGAALPNIHEALDCGDGPPDGPGLSNELQRYEVDTRVFPDALCNDGTVAALYFRRYNGEANRNRWVINLRGGGSCGNGGACAARWCCCRDTNRCPHATDTTNFSMQNMTGTGPASLTGEGIYLRGDAAHPNPIADYNQVRLVYCSSDAWHGTQRAVPLSAVHPITGAPVNYSIHFLGARILDADIATLRQDGVGPLMYRSGTASDAMPDLDDAQEVLIAGDSAGGAGTITNLDYLAGLLRANNNACRGATCPLTVAGLIDAIVGPDRSRLDFSQSVFAARGATTYDAYMSALAAGANEVGARHDESCVAWHTAHMPGTEHRCADESHVIRHHVTTPFFVRQALVDSLISQGYIDAGLRDPDLGPMNLRVFGTVLQRELSAFGRLPADAEEGAAMSMAPGVFAPACADHDTIGDTVQVYNVGIVPPGGSSALHLFDVMGNWQRHAANSVVLTQSMTDTNCR